MNSFPRLGALGFETAEESDMDAIRRTTACDYIILHYKAFIPDKQENAYLLTSRPEMYAWVWPPEYGRSLINDMITEVKK